MRKPKINYNDTFGTMHSRDYYRGASFHFSGKWISGAHYVSDDYNIDFVVHGQTLLACAKSHLSTLENEPTEFITDESGTAIGVISTYWDFVLSGIVGDSPGIKIIDNYWYICKNTGVPEEEQVWENTGVKAKMELSDLSPEEIALLQEPGKQVVTEFVNNTITQETGQNTNKIMSQKAVTDVLNTKATVSQVTSAITNEVQRADLTYQPKGDYATNTTVSANKTDADNKIAVVNERINTTNENVSNNVDAIQEEIENRESEIERIEGLISAEETARVESDNALSNRISQEATARSTADNNFEQSIANINSKIPSEASSSNQLADKDFVHNEISTSSATFKGTYNTLTELEAQEADNNDYGFVVHTDALGNTFYSRYKYNGTEWLWEYDITSTEFSQSQWEAVNSGINSTLVTKLYDLPTNADLTAALNNKVDKVTGKQLSTEDYTAAEKTKLAGIEANAQVNKLEGVQVNGTDLTITNKKVNVTVPTKTSQLTNDDNVVKDASYVHTDNNYTSTEKSKLSGIEEGAQVNKIEHIQINDTEQTISNKTVNLPAYPTTLPASDVYSWAKASTKPSYNFSEINGTVADSQLPDTISSDITGTAMGLKTEKLTGQEFVYRKSAATIKAKALTLDRIYGKTLAWNQKKKYNFSDVTSNGVTIHADSINHCYVFSGENSSGYTVFNTTNPAFIVGHKYFAKQVIVANPNNLTITTKYLNNNYSAIVGTGSIIFASTSTSENWGLYNINGTVDFTGVKLSVILIDLTLMFGAGNEPSTVAEFESMFPSQYYPYNPGQIISNDAKELETVGFNQWDEEWEVGGFYWSTGEPSLDTSKIRSKNFIPIIGGQKYYLKAPSSSTIIAIYYDVNKSHISSPNMNRDAEFEAPSNAAYMKLCDASRTTYNHDICINISDESKNGTYEPYRLSSMPLNLNAIKVYSHNIWDEEWEIGQINTSTGTNINNTSTDIRSKNFIPVIPGAYYYCKKGTGTNIYALWYDVNKSYLNGVNITNNIKQAPNNAAYIRFYTDGNYGSTYNNDICINVSSSFNGQYEPHGILTKTELGGGEDWNDMIVGNKLTVRRKRVNLGNLGTWSTASAEYHIFQSPQIPDMKESGTIAVAPNFVCSGYKVGTQNTITSVDKFITRQNYINTKAILIRDSSHNVLTSSDNWLDGVYLDYELATPIEYELADPLPTSMPAGTTESRISPNADGLSAPFCADITYSIWTDVYSEHSNTSNFALNAGNLNGKDGNYYDNIIEHIKIDGTEQTISSKTVNLPAYPTTLPASDVHEWAKASTKPSYNLSEIGNADDVKAIENLSGTSGFLKKTAANSWSLDTNTYVTARDLGEADLLTRINTLAYGIQWSKNSSTCTRIGNPLLHRTLPIQSQMKGCVEKNGEPVYWLDPSNWAYKANGDPSVLNGTDGYVRDYIPRFYGKSWDTEDYGRVMISTIKIDDTWVEIPEHFEDAYESALDRTNLKLCSVVNTSAQYRGGTNSSTYDSYEAMRSLLGKPATNFSRANARTYASNAGSELLNYNIYKWVFLWLPVIEYANFDLQTAINNNLTAEGYHQGGLGNGATTFSPWSAYNGYNPIIPCGLTNSLGNFSGQVGIDYSAFDSYSAGTVYANRYRGLECPFGDVWTNLDGIIVDANHSDYDLVYTCDDPSKYSDSITSAYTNTSRSIHTDGYVKEFDLGSTGEITAISVGGGKADYHYTGSVNSTLRTVLAGGGAVYGGSAGPGCLYSDKEVSYSNAYIGFRTIKRIY